MKKHFYTFLIFFVIVIISHSTIGDYSNPLYSQSKLNNTNFPIRNLKKPNEYINKTVLSTPPLDRSANKYSNIYKSLPKREYFFTLDSSNRAYQCPNREQNIRAAFASGIFTMKNRIDARDANWQISLNTVGIFADNILIEKPLSSATFSANENELVIIHQTFNEQYINAPDGLRQNFIINSTPENAENIKINIEVSGLLVNKVNDDELHFYRTVNGSNEKLITYNDLNVWDASNKKLDAHFEANDTSFCIVVNSAGAQYPITIDPLSTTATRVESNQANAQMGFSVSSAGDVNGDGYSDIIVGAPFYDKGQTDEGVAFIYHGSATGISNTPTAILESNQANAEFGYAVATACDVNGDGYSDVIVGAPFYDKGQTDEGVAFIYQGSASGLVDTPSKVVESNINFAQMGNAVSSAGDINGDGYSDIITGASNYTNGQTSEGAAYIFQGSASGINIIAANLIEFNQADAQLGNSVSSAGDINGDGFSDILIGAYKFDRGETDEGVVFIFLGSNTGLITTGPTLLEADQPNSYYGSSVSSAGDYNADGYSDIIIGAPGYSNGQTASGRVFIYKGSVSGINTVPIKALVSDRTNFNFGNAVAGAGDINGDGNADVIIGANKFDNSQTDEGAVYIDFGGNNICIGCIFIIRQPFVESDQNNANLGNAVASAGDVNGDGYSDILIGEVNFDNSETDEGAALIYYGSSDTATIGIQRESDVKDLQYGFTVACAGDINGDGLSDYLVGTQFHVNGQAYGGATYVYTSGLASTILESNVSNSQMGFSISSAGDVNGDGFSDIIVGAPTYTNGQSNEGAAYIYYGSLTGINTATFTKVESNQTGAQMGYAVSSAGDVNGDGFADILVGAKFYDNGQTNEGAAYLYYGSATGVNISTLLILESNQADANFGSAVSAAGDVNGDGFSDILVGSPLYDNGQTDEGGVFVYYGSIAGINANQYTFLEANQTNSNYGNAIATAGDINGDGFSDILVGASKFDNGQTDEGAVFIYYGNSAGINSLPDVQLESDQTNKKFGSIVASAGDVNGDGYSDFLISEYTVYNSSITNTGRVSLYYGTPTGMNFEVDFLFRQANTHAFGSSISSAGDINGDGLSDVIVGDKLYEDTPLFSSPQTAEGAIFIYLGNRNLSKTLNNVILYNTDLNTIINQNNKYESQFGVSLWAKSFLGVNKGKLVWEAKRNGLPFSSMNTITNSVQYSAQQNNYTNLTLLGTRLKSLVTKENGLSTKVRVRVKYSPVLAITGQIYGPWRYMPGYTSGANIHNNVPLPVALLSFTASLTEENTVLLQWATATEINNDYFLIQRSKDGINWETIIQTDGAGNSSQLINYSAIDGEPFSGISFYRLVQVDFNENHKNSNSIIIENNEMNNLTIYPNPVIQSCKIVFDKNVAYNKLFLYNSMGQQMQLIKFDSAIQHEVELDLSGYPAGTYFLKSENGTFSVKIIKLNP